MKYTSSSHYHIPITRPLLNRSKFNQIFFIKEITTENKSGKVKIATNLYRKFSHPRSKGLCDLVRKTGIKDSESIKI